MSTSSPVKRTKPAPSRQAHENSSTIKKTPQPEDFLTRHLSPVPKDLQWENSIDLSLLPKSKKANPEHLEKLEYQPFSKFLNMLSHCVRNYIEASTGEKHKPVEFIPNFGHQMTHHPAGPRHNTDSNYAPDLVGVDGPLTEDFLRPMRQAPSGTTSSGAEKSQEKEPKFKPVPYPLARTLVEMKLDDKNGFHQALSYCPYILEAGPHLVGLYVLSAKPQHYQIGWYDASGSVGSKRFAWNNLEPLVSYLYSLYVPPKNHILFDRTLAPHARGEQDLTRLLNGESVNDTEPSVEWNITTCGQVYDPCTVAVWTAGQGRRTMVFQKLEEDGARIIIKDAYRDQARRFKENDLLHYIHKDGIVPGVARLLDSEDVRDPVTGERVRTSGAVTYYGQVVQRYKTRLVLGSYGEQLLRAKTLGDLIKAIYDTVEVHRSLIMERNILHRDMSINNILMYPKHHPSSAAAGIKFFKPREPVRFIDQVLASGPGSPLDSPSDAQDCSRCLLIDFDNSAPANEELAKVLISQEYKPHAVSPPTTHGTELVTQELAERTGTPKFIARSVSQGIILGSTHTHVNFTRMPDLAGKARDKYTAAYGEETYLRWTDAPDRFHGKTAPTAPDSSGAAFTHRPCHDVESIFWTLLYSLVRVRPLGAQDETLEELTAETEQIKNQLFAHQIKGKATEKYVSDSRDSILRWEDGFFDDALHPGLRGRGLGQLLFRLSQQVRPEYARLQPEPPARDHLHEAFRRLLLDYIVALEDAPAKNVDLDTENDRNLLPPKQEDSASKRSTKRPAPGEYGQYSNKRSRTAASGTRYISSPVKSRQPKVQASTSKQST